MNKNILVFRTDRIGDLLHNCPSIKTIKEENRDDHLSLVASERNYLYAKTFDFIDKVYLFPKKIYLKKLIYLKIYTKKDIKKFTFLMERIDQY